ncbi:hypothetical protein L3Q82_008264 [Scortum barcoo]|uniref:Uncharacterized protein n=1 Tax=Scortum barcoo TaxID=214431 RepID=A0ACB8WHZ1_9TELE|nr:hypothetical protein L3Q82_008264 [Scortum barcoo]
MPVDIDTYDIQREEEKVKRSIKDAAKKGQKDVCVVLAKEMIQSKRAVTKLYASKAHMNSVQLSMKNQMAVLRVAGALQKSTEVMKAMQSLIKVPEIQATMRELSKEMMKAGIIEDMLEDTFESMEDGEEMEEAAEEEVDKILFEITAGALGKAPSKVTDALPEMEPTGATAASEDESEEDIEEMQRRRLDAPVIWRKLLPADSASRRLSSAMVSWIISRLVVLVFGTLYPAYSSYKAVKTKDVKEYVKWMMYWIIFALFTTVEVFTDMFLCCGSIILCPHCRLPFYYELKIAFVVWLLSPYTKGSSVLYRKFVHPTLSSKEKDIDDYIGQAKDKSYDTLVHFGRKGLNVAATAAVMAATKSQGVLSDRLRSFSMQDLSSYQSDPVNTGPGTTQSAAAQHRTRAMMRSKSESYNKGQDFDMTEYEVLDQWDSKGSLSQSISPSEPESTPVTPSLTPQSSPPSTPSPPPTPPAPEQPEEVGKGVQATSSSPQLRLIKRKAPEVYRLIKEAAQLLPDSNCPLRVVIYWLVH